MELLLLAPGAITTCLLLWALVRRETQSVAERDSLREELATARTDAITLARAHAEQLERIAESHREEVAVLCQRIQAPVFAAEEHAGRHVGEDPPDLDLENDLQMIERRRADIERMNQELLERAEDLATEQFVP